MTNPTLSPDDHADHLSLSELMVASPVVTVHISKVSALALYRDDLKVNGMNSSNVVISAFVLTDE